MSRSKSIYILPSYAFFRSRSLYLTFKESVNEGLKNICTIESITLVVVKLFFCAKISVIHEKFIKTYKCNILTVINVLRIILHFHSEGMGILGWFSYHYTD